MMNKLTPEEELKVKEQLQNSGIKFSEEDYKLLLNGGYSTLKENVRLKDGKVKDCKIKLKMNDNNQVILQYQFRKSQIVIPKKLGDKEFSDEEINALKNGELIKCNYEGNIMFLQLDKELNSIVVKFANEIDLNKVHNFEIGGYQFNQEEKNLLNKGEEVNGVVMKGKEGYFVANIKFTEDKKGIVYSGYKDLTKEEAKKLLNDKAKKVNSNQNVKTEKFNTSDKAIENIASSQKHSDKEITPKKDDVLKKYEQQIYDAVRNDDFKKVKSLAENKPAVSPTLLNKINNDSNISKDAKIAANTILTVDPKSEQRKLKEEIKEEKPSIKVEDSNSKKPIKNKTTGRKRNKAEKLANTAFNDM